MKVNFEKYTDGLVPAVVQDIFSGKVLMVGFMNSEALNLTLQSQKVTFYSRSKKRIWVKGEESGNFLLVKNVSVDCDEDTLLIKAAPSGPVCHTGSETCWNESINSSSYFIHELEEIISKRIKENDEKSYTASLIKSGLNKVAQKVGEEAVELVIEAKDNNEEKFLGEAADLLFHYLVLLQAKNHRLSDVTEVLKKRHKK